MSELKLESEARTDRGTNEAGRMRRDGRIPGNVISGGKSQVISFSTKDFQRLIQKGLRTSTLIQLDVNGGDMSGQVIVKEIQRHPVSGDVLHVDFYRVTEGRKTIITVPIETTGFAKGVKAGGALEQYISKLKVRTTPEYFREVITVDVTDLNVEDGVHLSQLGTPPEWEIILQGDPIIVRVARSRMTVKSTDSAGGEGVAEAAAEGEEAEEK